MTSNLSPPEPKRPVSPVPATPAQDAAPMAPLPSPSAIPPANHLAAALSKTSEQHHGGVTQRGMITRQIQRQLGNQRTQRIIDRARQSDPWRAGPALARLPIRGAPPIQRLGGSVALPTGVFDVDMPAAEGAVVPETGVKHWGLHGKIQFTAGKGSPLSNKINLVQIAKSFNLDTGKAPATAALPADRRKQVDTAADPVKGVESDYHTDVWHYLHKKGDALHPSYQFRPVYGYHRSDDDPGDTKAAELTDTPGLGGTTGRFSFNFETVARGDDNMVDYGAVKWAFNVQNGKVGGETMDVRQGTSETFKAALEKHRDFYVHEPVTFYFGFDSAAPMAGEVDKIDTFLDYLRRNADVHLRLEGFADQRGDAGYNRGLAMRRCEAIRQALVTKGVAAARIDAPAVATGRTTAFTSDKAAADQDREALRRWNRRVTLTFVHAPPP